jgi:hypothetical protein
MTGSGHRQTTAKAAPRGRSPARQSGETARLSAAFGSSLLVMVSGFPCVTMGLAHRTTPWSSCTASA